MHTIRFDPTNESAKRAFSQLVCARKIIAAAAYDLGFIPDPDLVDESLEAEFAGDDARSELGRLLRHSLIAQPRLSVLSRDGRVSAHISHIDDSDAMDLLMDVETRFAASTMRRGSWRTAISHQQPSVEPMPEMRRYKIGRLELPVSATGAAEPDLDKAAIVAVAAARLTWERDAPFPADALRQALRAPIEARWVSGRLHQREATHEPAVDVQICTGVELEIAAGIDGPVFLGRNTASGNGLLVSTKHR